MRLMTAEEIRFELIELTKLRAQALISDSNELWDRLDREISRIEGHTIPQFDVNYMQEAECYCLRPRPIVE